MLLHSAGRGAPGMCGEVRVLNWSGPTPDRARCKTSQLYGCVAEWKMQQGYAVQESATHSNLLRLKQPPRTGTKLVAYCLHHAGFKSPPHPPKRPFVGVVALSTNKVQPSAATASVWQYAAFGKGQRRATDPRQFDSAEPHHARHRMTSSDGMKPPHLAAVSSGGYSR